MTRHSGSQRLFVLPAIMVFAAVAVHAASIPAWLDDAISRWNGENPEVQIRFVDIKDSFVWYSIPENPEIGHQDIRGSIYDLVVGEGYEVTNSEELVTTGKPPTPRSAHVEKKCWTRSYVRNVEELSDTRSVRGGRAAMRQTMLTSLVCQDVGTWYAGFRVLQ